MSDIFEEDRWSLFIELDLPEHQDTGDYEGRTEQQLLKRQILDTFGGLPEEYDEVVRIHDDGRWELSSPYLAWFADIIKWITMHCIPCEVRLVRNEERQP